MSIVSQVVHPVREFFTLRGAERVIRAYVPGQRERVREHVEAAIRRQRAGRRVTDAVPAAILLRAAVVEYLVAIEAARAPDSDLDALVVSTAMPTLAPDPARPRAEPSDDRRVRDALSSRDAMVFDRMSAEDAERSRWALDRAAAMLRKRVEGRTLTNVRGARWGRVLAMLLLLGYAVLLVLRAKVFPQDIALGKPVHASSRKPGTPDGHELVDGDIGTSYGIHTATEDDPTVVIDLVDSYWVNKVVVHNRIDGWFDDCLPLVVELSVDGKTWDPVGRREEHFDASPGWTIDAGGRRATQVRLRVPRKSYIALSEVEVFGKKELR